MLWPSLCIYLCSDGIDDVADIRLAIFARAFTVDDVQIRFFRALRVKPEGLLP